MGILIKTMKPSLVQRHTRACLYKTLERLVLSSPLRVKHRPNENEIKVESQQVSAASMINNNKKGMLKEIYIF
jgi:hypothetical protein